VSKRDRDSVFDEPHMRREGPCWKCGYDRAGLSEQDVCPECGAGAFQTDKDEAAQIDHSVWDEAGLTADAAAAHPGTGADFATWVRAKQAETSWLMSWAVTWGVAVLAGPWGVLAALMDGIAGNQSEVSWSSVFATVIVGPAVEEVAKVALLAYVVERRPYLFKSGTQVLLCALAGGASFAAIENLLYLHVYIDRPTPDLVAWRWSACVALHSVCSLIAGAGLWRVWEGIWPKGERPELLRSFPFTLAAITVHGLYNGTMIAMAIQGKTF
jgi:hypothetical protein